MGKDRQIIISKSLLQRSEIRKLSIVGKVTLLAMAMEVNEEGNIYFPGWKAPEYGIGKSNFYNATRELKAKGFIENISCAQGYYRLTDDWKQGRE